MHGPSAVSSNDPSSPSDCSPHCVPSVVGPRLPALQQMAEDAYCLGRADRSSSCSTPRARYDLLQARVDLAAALLEAQIRYLATAGDLESRLVPAASR
jgi:hypothetical protein